MVHRPADSRLLANLLTHEKEYSKHLFSLLEYSQASLASFSAYASASAPPASQVILAVAGSLAGADDALRRYALAVDEWREQLKTLRELEDDVGNIMRDREILVTRLIKASKSQKPTRESLLLTHTSHPSSSSSSIRSDFSASLGASSKLSAAQAELQACEAHLAAKERELDERRAGAVTEGLRVRCTAMVECGWAWGEMGKEGLRALEGMADMPARTSYAGPSSSTPNTVPPQAQLQTSKPLPDPNRPSSDLSSVGPSQSASQVNLVASEQTNNTASASHYPSTAPTSQHTQSSSKQKQSQNNNPNYASNSGPRSIPNGNAPFPESHLLQIAPAHSISENDLPTSMSMPMLTRSVLPRRITEESLRHGQLDGGSSDEEDVGPLQVVENERFVAGGATGGAASGSGSPNKRFSIRVVGTKSDLGQPSGPAIPTSEKSSPSSNRDRKASFFGSIRGFFRHQEKNEFDFGSAGGSPKKGEKKWATRTDRNLKGIKKGDGDSSDDEAPRQIIAMPKLILMPETPSPTKSPSKPGGSTGRAGGKRLKKGNTVRQNATKKPKDGGKGVGKDEGKDPAADTSKPKQGVEKAEEWVGTLHQVKQEEEQQQQQPGPSTERGGTSDGAAHTGGAGVTRTKSKGKKGGSPKSGITELVKADGAKSLARNPSITSAQSAPATSTPKPTRRQTVDSATAAGKSGAGQQQHNRRAASLDLGNSSPGSSLVRLQTKTKQGDRERERERHTARVSPATGQAQSMSLMSIVEDVAKQNREAWKNWDQSMGVDPSSSVPRMEIVRAPAPLSRSSIDAMLPAVKSGGDLGPKGGGFYNMQASTSAPSLLGQEARPSRPVKSPLRSALRNASRTPSPSSQGPIMAPEAQGALSTKATAAKPSTKGKAKESIQAGNTGADMDDSSSLSSYETGNEGFDDDEDTEREDNPPPPPPHDHSGSSSKTGGMLHVTTDRPPSTADSLLIHTLTPMTENKGFGSEQSASTASMDIAASASASGSGAPQRRKSVRVSLKPTFSPTPPAIYLDEDEHEPWGSGSGNGNGWSDRGGGVGLTQAAHEPRDIWEDSSEEDEEYKQARKMLSRGVLKREKKAQ